MAKKKPKVIGRTKWRTNIYEPASKPDHFTLKELLDKLRGYNSMKPRHVGF